MGYLFVHNLLIFCVSGIVLDIWNWSGEQLQKISTLKKFMYEQKKTFNWKEIYIINSAWSVYCDWLSFFVNFQVICFLNFETDFSIIFTNALFLHI